MEPIENQVFRNQDVNVDGQQFKRCTFQNARLVFAGGALPTFIDCRFSGVSLAFSGGAANTIAFLTGIKGRGFDAAVSKLTSAVREHKV